MRRAIDYNEIKKVNVESSNVKSIGYDEGVLAVEFKNGGKYLYLDVEGYHFKNLMENCQSVGKYLSDNIKNNYTCVKGF